MNNDKARLLAKVGQTTGSLAAENVAAARRDGLVIVKPPVGPRPVFKD